MTSRQNIYINIERLHSAVLCVQNRTMLSYIYFGVTQNALHLLWGNENILHLLWCNKKYFKFTLV